jgi:hypothetical protein
MSASPDSDRTGSSCRSRAWLIDQRKGLSMRAKLTAVAAVSAGYVSLMSFVFLKALDGVPLVRM